MTERMPITEDSGATTERPSSSSSMDNHIDKPRRWKRPVGLLLLALVVFLWTATNFLASAMMADHTYSKPYFVAYFNTSFFILPMLPVLVHKAFQHPKELQDWYRECTVWMRGCFGYGRKYNKKRGSNSQSSERLLGDEPTSAHMLNSRNTTSPMVGQLSLRETAKLSLEFCILWFLANYFVAACLEYTTVASSTILTSTSGVFTLIFGSIFGVEKFTIRKLLGVLASLTGIILISSVDLSGGRSDEDHRGHFPEKSPHEVAVGNILALLSAVFYGLYSVLMKKRISDESLVNMPIFFGFVGIINVLLLWPGFFILHWTGIEPFELPSHGRVTALLVSNASGSLISDIAWAYAVLLTSPIVVTVGLSLTIPLSLVGEMVLNSQSASALYWVGAIIVVVSFVFVNHEEKKENPLNSIVDRGILDEAHTASSDEHL